MLISISHQYLSGYMERMGTGIPDMVKACINAGLKEPELIQEEDFRTILWRSQKPTDQPTDQVVRLVILINKEMTRRELMTLLGLKHAPTFRRNYLHPALEGGWIEMTKPERLHNPTQKYRLTLRGIALRNKLKQK